MIDTFARVGATAEKMRVEDVHVQGSRTWLRLNEKGGKRHEMSAHHNLKSYLQEYIEKAGLDASRSRRLERFEPLERMELLGNTAHRSPQELAGKRTGSLGDLFGRSLGYDVAALLAALGT